MAINALIDAFPTPHGAWNRVTAFGSKLRLEHRPLKAERLHTDESPRSLFVKIHEEFENAFLLESAIGPKRLAEYSFIGFEPETVVSAKGGRLAARSLDGSKDGVKTSDPLTELRALVTCPSSTPRRSPFRFVGGAVGYISYDSVRYWERLPAKAKDDLSLPDMEFGIYSDGIAFDHIEGTVHYYTLGSEGRLEKVESLLRSAPPGGERLLGAPAPAEPTVEREEFKAMVETAKGQIAAGDIFQVVLSKRYDFRLDGDLSVFYEALGAINPSPYMYFLKFGDRRIIGSSPEMLLRVEDRRVETFPIAGTRPRLADKKENDSLTREMLADPKERAEHVMLVDLARNDVGRVASYGSVKVPELLDVQQFSHVQHMVSRVVGRLRPEFDSFDAMRAMFPAGTVSGAPKPRAMEIIEELEPVRRGPYAGALGYFSFNGNADFAITIRTLVARGGRCSVQSGAGIVADSDPDREWLETESKAAGLMKAVERASGVPILGEGRR
ncbi:MAG: anthranilate synthase component I [Nitrososphaerota archaeon]|nr:anthranilate synthase component I [Nitrososphaerota archaeon]